MVSFKRINLLNKTEESYELLQLENIHVEIPDLVLAFKNKYTQDEILYNRTLLLSVIEERISVIKDALVYLLGETCFFTFLHNDSLLHLNLSTAIKRYNQVLTKKYTNNNTTLSSRDKYLIDKYQILEPTSFLNKEKITSDDFMSLYLMSLINDYRHYKFFLEEVRLFLNDITSVEKKKNDFFSFLYFQYEYYFFIYTLYSFLCDQLFKKFKKNTSFIDENIYKASMLLNFSFAKSNKGLYHDSSDLSYPFLGFLELHIKDLYLLINKPDFNFSYFYNYIENKYGDKIYPFCITDSNNKKVFNMFDNMIDFSYMQDFINSYLRFILNTNSLYLFKNIKEIKEEIRTNKNE